jgi:hypothetical protein
MICYLDFYKCTSFVCCPLVSSCNFTATDMFLTPRTHQGSEWNARDHGKWDEILRQYSASAIRVPRFQPQIFSPSVDPSGSPIRNEGRVASCV